MTPDSNQGAGTGNASGGTGGQTPGGETGSPEGGDSGNTAGSGGSPVGSGGLSSGGNAGEGSETAGGGGSAGAMNRPEPTCSDEELRTGPPPGKEFLKADPMNETFPFSTHWMGRFNDNPSAVGITGLADFDNDGDLDFASGQRGGQMQWWEYCSPDHWVQHVVGGGHNSPGGGNAMDVDEDGWVDLIAGDSWYKNPGNPRESEWERHGIGVSGAEDIAVGDVNGDGKPDALWVINSIDPQWRSPGADPTDQWPLGFALPNRQQQGGFIGDVDGDGDNDILVGNRWWYRNNGQGTAFETVGVTTGFDDSPLTTMGDLDGDGDMDFAMCTHFGNRIAWVENMDGQGNTWELHVLASNKAVLHSVFAMDFDNDGDLDLYTGQSTGQAWIYENTGPGNFVEHGVAQNGRGHDSRVGDVDCDGDLDIVGKPWGENEAEPRDHIYLQNMLVEQGGPAVFERPAGEVWHPVQTRMYCP